MCIRDSTLRHSYATHMLQHGVSLRKLQDILGHSCPKTTARYTHLTEICEQNNPAALDLVIKDLMKGNKK